MQSQPVIFDLAETADERFDPVIESLLVGALAFAPLAFGAVQPWSELVVLALAAAMVLVFVVKLLARPDVRMVRTWAYVPVVSFLVIVAAQLVPLPAAVVRVISPQTHGLRADLLRHVPEGARHLDVFPLSFYPEATAADLRMLLAVSGVFLVVVNVIRRLGQVRRILGAAAVIGTAVALLALAQDVTDASRIYWIVPIESNQANAGPFVNHNHFAQFMNLSMGAALALMLMQLDQLPRRRRPYDDAGVSRAAAALTQPITPLTWMLACAVVLMAVVVPLSLSRGGMISMLAAGIVTTLVLATRRGLRGRTWIFVGLVLAVLAILLLVQFEPVLGRATRIDDPTTITGRLDLVRGAVAIGRTFPSLGTGMGSFEHVFPLFEPGDGRIPLVAEHAENQYAQVFAEAGIAGLVLVAGFLLLLAAAYARCVRGGPSPMASAAMGLGFGLVAVAVHSAADFGQHVPGVAIWTAVSAGLLINLAHATRRGQRLPETAPGRPRLWPRLGLAVAVVTAFGVAIVQAADVWRADVYRARAEEIERFLVAAAEASPDPSHVRSMVEAAARAVTLRPGDVRGRFEWNRARWRAVEIASGDRRGVAAAVAEDLLGNAWRAPTFALPYFFAGQLRRGVLEDPRGGELIRLAHRLNPGRPDVCLEAAVLDADLWQWEAAMEKFARAIELREPYRAEVVTLLIRDFGRPDLAFEVARGDLGTMRHLAAVARDQGLPAEIVRRADRRVDELLLERAATPEAPASVLAEAAYLLRERGDHEAAIGLFRRALSHDFAATKWRVDLARTLHQSGRREEALREAHTALQRSPADRSAQELVHELTPSLDVRGDASPPGAGALAAEPSTQPTPGPERRFKLN